ncbi:MAG: hypothetical protein ACR2PL_07480 [Dehalococcoidia bacterium]
MAAEPQKLSVSADSELAKYFKDAEQRATPLVVDTGEETYHVSVRRFADKEPRGKKRSSRARGLTHDDSLWSVVGIGKSAEPTDVSSKKHKYLAEGIYNASHRQNS